MSDRSCLLSCHTNITSSSIVHVLGLSLSIDSLYDHRGFHSHSHSQSIFTVPFFPRCFSYPSHHFVFAIPYSSMQYKHFPPWPLSPSSFYHFFRVQFLTRLGYLCIQQTYVSVPYNRLAPPPSVQAFQFRLYRFVTYVYSILWCFSALPSLEFISAAFVLDIFRFLLPHNSVHKRLYYHRALQIRILIAFVTFSLHKTLS